MEPRYIASRVARNSAISTRYLAAFAAICLVSTIVLSIGALMLSTFSDDQIARAICICLDVCFLHISLAITGVIVDMLQLVMVVGRGPTKVDLKVYLKWPPAKMSILSPICSSCPPWGL